jgi:hypothetical protein
MRICVRALVRALLTGRRAKFQVVSLQFDLLDEERVRALQKKVFTRTACAEPTATAYRRPCHT